MNRMNKLGASIMAMLLVCAGAEAEILTGNCGAEGDGSNAIYEFDRSTGHLEISGTGEVNFNVHRDELLFSFSEEIHTCKINEGITCIGDGAFSSCFNLRDITLPNSLMTIGESAFSGCGGLISVVLPNSLISIGYQAFVECCSLTDIMFPGSLTTIGSAAFSGCI